MTKAMKTKAAKIFKHIGEYITLMEKEGYYTANGFIWIRDDETGEIMIFASSAEKVRQYTKYLK